MRKHSKVTRKGTGNWTARYVCVGVSPDIASTANVLSHSSRGSNLVRVAVDPTVLNPGPVSACALFALQQLVFKSAAPASAHTILEA